jgi:uncharacterized protein (DUF952 family)
MNNELNSEQIFHITSRSHWQQVLEIGVYEAESLKNQGFIHFSTFEQMLATANRFFLGQSDLVLLCVEPQKLQAELKFEEVPGVGIFPHLYGVLNLDAVEEIVDFEPNTEGRFELI